jgi:hypothetical protein
MRRVGNVPASWSVVEGAVVPMPTLPLEFICIAVEVAFHKLPLVPAGVVIKEIDPPLAEPVERPPLMTRFDPAVFRPLPPEALRRNGVDEVLYTPLPSPHLGIKDSYPTRRRSDYSCMRSHPFPHLGSSP